MSLVPLSEPDPKTESTRRRLAVGIDLGTTHSLVAVLSEQGKPAALRDEQGQYLLPSAVRYLPHRIEVGYNAKRAAADGKADTIFSIKRLMGRDVEEAKRLTRQAPYAVVEQNGLPAIETAQGAVNPLQVSAEILKTLKQRAEAHCEEPLYGAVITVPAYFDDGQRQAVKDAAKLTDIHVLRLVNEPTAAALAYGLERQTQGTVAVYDLGGGTFDISILRLEQGVFRVLSTGGDTALGGDDFDRALAAWHLRQTAQSQHADQSLLLQACAAKEQLTVADTARLGDTTITRAQFEQLIAPWLDKTVTICRRALHDAEFDAAQIDQIILVGGSTRIPAVRQAVAALFGKAPLTDIDPDQTVAFGAALQADMLAGNRRNDTLLLDVAPLSLGIETMGGLTEKLIERNTPVPAVRSQEFTTFKDNQTAMSIHVLQGERELAQDCRSLAHFELKGIPPMAAGLARIQVTFQIDADGLLNVSASEQTTGTRSHIEVKPSYGLNAEQMHTMLEASFAHAEADVAARKLREQQIHAESLLTTVEKALREDGDLLDTRAHTDIESQCRKLRQQTQSGDTENIMRAIQALNDGTQTFAELRMNRRLKQVLQDRPVGAAAPSAEKTTYADN